MARTEQVQGEVSGEGSSGCRRGRPRKRGEVQHSVRSRPASPSRSPPTPEYRQMQPANEAPTTVAQDTQYKEKEIALTKEEFLKAVDLAKNTEWQVEIWRQEKLERSKNTDENMKALAFGVLEMGLISRAAKKRRTPIRRRSVSAKKSPGRPKQRSQSERRFRSSSPPAPRSPRPRPAHLRQFQSCNQPPAAPVTNEIQITNRRQTRSSNKVRVENNQPVVAEPLQTTMEDNQMGEGEKMEKSDLLSLKEKPAPPAPSPPPPPPPPARPAPPPPVTFRPVTHTADLNTPSTSCPPVLSTSTCLADSSVARANRAHRHRQGPPAKKSRRAPSRQGRAPQRPTHEDEEEVITISDDEEEQLGVVPPPNSGRAACGHNSPFAHCRMCCIEQRTEFFKVTFAVSMAQIYLSAMAVPHMWQNNVSPNAADPGGNHSVVNEESTIEGSEDEEIDPETHGRVSDPPTTNDISEAPRPSD